MVKLALVFAAAFAVSAVLGSQAGCVLSDPCDCRPTPERPEPQGPLTELAVSSYDPEGNAAEVPIVPEAGTLEVTTDSVVITYEQDSATFRVEYEILGPAGLP